MILESRLHENGQDFWLFSCLASMVCCWKRVQRSADVPDTLVPSAVCFEFLYSRRYSIQRAFPFCCGTHVFLLPLFSHPSSTTSFISHVSYTVCLAHPQMECAIGRLFHLYVHDTQSLSCSLSSFQLFLLQLMLNDLRNNGYIWKEEEKPHAIILCLQRCSKR